MKNKVLNCKNMSNVYFDEDKHKILIRGKEIVLYEKKSFRRFEFGKIS